MVQPITDSKLTTQTSNLKTGIPGCMTPSTASHPWHYAFGRQRNWQWRGWRVRYTYYRSQNSGEANSALPILMVHGFGSALTQWRHNVQVLSQHHPVYALDLVGFGGSEKASAPYKVEFWVEQIFEFWDTFIGRPVVLVGHSLGALVALSTVVAHPALAQGLVLMTLPASRQEMLPTWASAIAGTMERVFANSWVVRPLFRLMQQPSMMRRALNLAYTDPSRVTDELVELYCMPTWDRGAAQTLVRLSKAATHPSYAPNTIQLLDRLNVPTLVLWGECDRIVQLKNRQIIFDHHPCMQLRTVPDAGHCAYEESADVVNQEILHWARTVSSTVNSEA